MAQTGDGGTSLPAITSVSVTSLPFVHDAAPEDPLDEKRCFWRVHPSGELTSDIRRGASFTRHALAYMRRFDFPPLLGWIVRDMIAKGRFDGLEIGFLRLIATAIMNETSNDRHHSLCL